MEQEIKSSSSSGTQPVILSCSPAVSDGISLFEMWEILLRKKKSNLCIILFFGFVSTALAFFVPATYKVSATFVQPPLSYSMPLNFSVDFIDLSGESDFLFDSYRKNVALYNVQYKFVKENGVLEKLTEYGKEDETLHEVFQREFRDRLSVAGEEDTMFSVEFIGRDPQLITKWLKDFIAFVDNYTVRKRAGEIKFIIDFELNSVNTQLEALRKSVQEEKAIRITMLKQAASIAQKYDLDLEKNIEAQSTDTLEGGGGLSEPLFSKGREFLLAEVEELEYRKGDEIYISGVAELIVKQKVLQELTVNHEQMRAVFVDSQPQTPEEIYGPNRILIIGAGIVLGFVFASAWCLFRAFYEHARAQRNGLTLPDRML